MMDSGQESEHFGDEEPNEFEAQIKLEQYTLDQVKLEHLVADSDDTTSPIPANDNRERTPSPAYVMDDDSTNRAPTPVLLIPSSNVCEKQLQCEDCGVCVTVNNKMNTRSRGKPFKCQPCKNLSADKTDNNSADAMKEKPAKPQKKWNQCQFCAKGFKKPSDLIRHERTHTGERPYQCDICQRWFSTKGSLTLHYRTHTGERPYACDICDKGYTTSQQLKAHMNTHTGEKPYKCQFCDKSYSHYSARRNHMWTHAKEKPRCSQCDKQFTSMHGLRKHTAVVHTNKPKKSKGSKKVENVAENSDDDSSEDGADVIRKQIPCEKCGKCVTVKYSTDTDIESLLDQPFKCEKCTKREANEEKITKERNRIALKPKKNKCQYCDKPFRKPSDLIRHERTHTGERPYPCNACEKSFSTPATLSLHVRTHTGEKPYVCHMCNRGFAASQQLKAHKNTHTGERPYKCQFCDKCYTNSSSLRSHKLAHSADKPQCAQCGKQFATYSGLYSHNSSEHNNPLRYQCDFCMKYLPSKYRLTLHKRTHTGERPYMCEICGMCFLRSSRLNKHKLMHERNKTYKPRGGTRVLSGPSFRKTDVKLSREVFAALKALENNGSVEKESTNEPGVTPPVVPTWDCAQANTFTDTQGNQYTLMGSGPAESGLNSASHVGEAIPTTLNQADVTGSGNVTGDSNVAFNVNRIGNVVMNNTGRSLLKPEFRCSSTSANGTTSDSNINNNDHVTDNCNASKNIKAPHDVTQIYSQSEHTRLNEQVHVLANEQIHQRYAISDTNVVKSGNNLVVSSNSAANLDDFDMTGVKIADVRTIANAHVGHTSAINNETDISKQLDQCKIACQICKSNIKYGLWLQCKWKNPATKRNDCLFRIHQVCGNIYCKTEEEISQIPFYCRKHGPHLK